MIEAEEKRTAGTPTPQEEIGTLTEPPETDEDTHEFGG